MCFFKKKEIEYIFVRPEDSITRIAYEIQQKQESEKEYLTVKVIEDIGFPGKRVLIMLVSESGWSRLLRSTLWRRVEKYLLDVKTGCNRKSHQVRREK